MSDEPFLSRWSRRKTEAKSAEPVVEKVQTVDKAAEALPAAEAPEPLPPLDSLTPESDFTAFMKPGIDPALKRDAFKKLIADPRYNVMDGLDVYIDDYSKPDPLPEGWLEKMNQVRHLGIFREEEEAPAPPEAVEGAPAAMPIEAAAFPQPAEPLDTSAAGQPPAPVAEKRDMQGGS